MLLQTAPPIKGLLLRGNPMLPFLTLATLLGPAAEPADTPSE